MGKNNTRILITVLALVLTAVMMIQEAKSIPLCNVDTNDLQKCRPAVTGNHPPPPTSACCTVAKTANLECLCPFLSRSGIDPSKLKALFANCGVNNPSCLPWSIEELRWTGHKPACCVLCHHLNIRNRVLHINENNKISGMKLERPNLQGRA
uniref:Bifunctional inhibitor/plant lipid transfer protein/seed storage helical domain-containing protein n=1 Tax=Brassica oleracea var. oleracea TaxID=109376 RepID=A0A0D3ALX8_BRAOL